MTTLFGLQQLINEPTHLTGALLCFFVKNCIAETNTLEVLSPK